TCNISLATRRPVTPALGGERPRTFVCVNTHHGGCVRTSEEGVMWMVTGGFCALLATMMYGHTLDAAPSCEKVSALKLPNTLITLAQMVPAGGFTVPGMSPAATQ